jgi:hypothetical protein
MIWLLIIFFFEQRKNMCSLIGVHALSKVGTQINSWTHKANNVHIDNQNIHWKNIQHKQILIDMVKFYKKKSSHFQCIIKTLCSIVFNATKTKSPQLL